MSVSVWVLALEPVLSDTVLAAEADKTQPEAKAARKMKVFKIM